MGHPDEFGDLPSIAEANGFQTHCICLPQHGNSPGSIGKTDWKEMLTVCQRDIDTFREQFQEIHLIGFSLGGALSMVLVKHNPGIFKTLTLVAAPYKSVFNLEFGHYHLKHFFTRFIPGTGFHKWSTGLPKPIFKALDMPRFYTKMKPFFTEVQSAAREIEIPTLLLHAHYDITVPYEHSEWLHQTIPGETNFITLLKAGHQVFPFHVNGIVEDAILNHLYSVKHCVDEAHFLPYE